MDEATRNLVRERAEGRCEYCRFRQDDEPFFRYQTEHIIAKQHGGTITFASVPNSFTEFELKIPRTAPQSRN